MREKLFGDLVVFKQKALLGDIKMQSHINYLIIIIMACLVSVGFGQEAAPVPESPAVAGDVNTTDISSFPYVAEITGDNVYIRSGPGTNYYNCSKLNKGDRVEVVSTQYSWSRISRTRSIFS